MSILHGFRGKPAHGPLTDASVGGFTVGSLLFLAGWALSKGSLIDAAFWALAVGLITAVPTMITGYADYRLIKSESGLKKTARFHSILMIITTVLYLGATYLVYKDMGGGVSLSTGLAVLLSFGFLVIGGTVGGTLAYGYGMRVEKDPPDTPMREALKPKPYDP